MCHDDDLSRVTHSELHIGDLKYEVSLQLKAFITLLNQFIS